MMFKSTDTVIGVVHESLLGSGCIINMLLLLTLYGRNYFVSCNRCCTVLSVKQPLIPNVWEAVQTLQQMWILWKREKSLEKYFLFLWSYSMVTIQIVPSMHLVTFIRFVEKDNVCFW